LGGSLGLWPTKRMDATSTSPRVTRHVWRASDGGSGGVASARPHDQFAVAQLRSALLILDPFVRLHAIGSPPMMPTAPLLQIPPMSQGPSQLAWARPVAPRAEWEASSCSLLERVITGLGVG